MSEPRKKHAAGFWAMMVVVAAVAVPFIYLASLGPISFLCSSGMIEDVCLIMLPRIRFGFGLNVLATGQIGFGNRTKITGSGGAIWELRHPVHEMTRDRKHPTTFWITVALVAVLVGYPLSFGPACWFSWQSPNSVTDPVISRVYKPLIVLSLDGPEPVRDWLRRWAEFYAPAVTLKDGSAFSGYKTRVTGVLQWLRDEP